MNDCSRLPPPARAAFALMDAVALVGCVATLMGLLLPSLAKSEQGGQAAVCLNNLRQMARASLMYASDSQDKFPGALQGGPASSPLPNDPAAPWAVGWLTWDTSSHNTNTLYVADPRYASLAHYTASNRFLVKCPADRYLSDAQLRKGWSERVRSIAVSAGIGKGNAEDGPWDPRYRHVVKTGDILYPSPSETWLFLDEHPDSMDDPGFYPPPATEWIERPASYHNGAGGFGFVDGRVEQHKWHGNTVWPVRARYVTFPTSVSRTDIDWLRYHTPRNQMALWTSTP